MLGESFYSQGSYKEAAENFLSGFQKFPEDVKAPENLLKLGMSLARLGQAQEACLTYQRLLSQYNNAPEYTINLATIERERVGCQI
jgi:TolA-binding protein